MSTSAASGSGSAPRALAPYQTSYLSLSLESGVLSFAGAPYTLKSGRKSPYFFNAGLFNTGKKIDALASCYASAIVQSGIQFDVLFGPAYKGIPLAACTALALSRDHGLDVGFCYNRKEAKAHGEGGTLVGAPLRGRVLVIDDVMTAGTAIGEAVGIIEAAAAADKGAAAEGQGAAEETRLVGIVIALDRQERLTEGPGASGESTVSAVSRRYGVPVLPVVTLADIIAYMQARGTEEDHKAVQAMQEYRERYGAKE